MSPRDAVAAAPTPGQATRLAIGLVAGVVETASRMVTSAGASPDTTDGSGSTPTSTRAGDLAVGALVEVDERLRGVWQWSSDALALGRPFSRFLGDLPGVRPVRESAQRRVDALAQRGALEQREGRSLVGGTIDSAIADALASELLERTIDDVVEQLLPTILEKALPSVLDQISAQPELLVPMVESLLGPILDSALPEVLDKLNEQPEVVRELVLGQSVSIAGEVASEVRTRGAVADDIAERIARRLTLRKPRAQLDLSPRHPPVVSSRPVAKPAAPPP